jgi:YidC/Oxa1 family membrane protein insertase
VTLTYASAQGLTFKRIIAVDDKYMFTVTDTVTNTGTAPINLAPFGMVKRQGVPDEVFKSAFNVHQGAVGYLEDKLQMVPYADWKKKDATDAALHASDKGGWLGITDKYWMAALIPDQSKHVKTSFDEITDSGVDVYETGFRGDQVLVAPGQSTTATTRLFAGAKLRETLNGYEKNLGVPKFSFAIDWGRLFWWLTQPVTILLDLFNSWVGNFGVAILMLTVVVKLLLFPLANQGFASMSKMKKVQPQIDDLKKRFAGDPQKLQQETMALYGREKINPLAGCLPIALQFPVFIALLRVLAININMHQAHFLWLDDLSSRDPTTIWNLFGLIPWDPATAPLIGTYLDGFLHLGVIAILYGAVMYLQQSLSPASPDPTQQQMMKFIPIIFVFFMARYPVGLMLYWTWSATLSIIQQYFIMHRYKVDNPIDNFIARLRGKPDASNVEVLPPLDKPS